MKKLEPITPCIEAMCYRIASNFLMFYKFDIPVDSIEIKSELEGCVNVLMDSPSENFTEDSFNGKAGQMLEINKICLYEKLRSFAVTILAGVGAEFKYRRRKLPHRWYYFKTNSKGEYYINPYTIIYAEMTSANKLLGYNLYNELNFFDWEEEVEKLLQTDSQIWNAIKVIAKFLDDSKIENETLVFTGEQLENIFRWQIKEPGALCYKYDDKIYGRP